MTVALGGDAPGLSWINGDQYSYYVSTTGNDNRNGRSWQTAKASIASALAALGNHSGRIYLGNGNFIIKSVDALGNAVSLTTAGQQIIGMGSNATVVTVDTDCTWGIQARAARCTVSGLQLIINNGRTVTYGLGVSTPAAVGSCQQCTFFDVFETCSGNVTAAYALGPDWPGVGTVDIASTLFFNCWYNGTPVHGFYAGNGTTGNVLINKAINCGGTGSQFGVTINGGGLNFSGGGFSNTIVADINILHGAGQVMSFDNVRGENGKRFLDVGYIGGSQGITLRDCYAGSYTPADTIIIQHNAAGTLKVDNGYYDAGVNTSIVINSAGSPGSVSSFVADDVTLANTTKAGWPAYNPASYIRLIRNAMYANAGVIQPNSNFAFVNDGGGQRTFAAKAANYAMTPADSIITMNGVGLTGSFPDPNLVPFGQPYTFTNFNASPATINSTAGATINGAASVVLNQWQSITVVKVSAIGWISI